MLRAPPSSRAPRLISSPVPERPAGHSAWGTNLTLPAHRTTSPPHCLCPLPALDVQLYRLSWHTCLCAASTCLQGRVAAAPVAPATLRPWFSWVCREHHQPLSGLSAFFWCSRLSQGFPFPGFFWSQVPGSHKTEAEKQGQQLKNPRCQMSVEALQTTVIQKVMAGERNEIRHECKKSAETERTNLGTRAGRRGRVEPKRVNSAFSTSQPAIGKGYPTPQAPRG